MSKKPAPKKPAAKKPAPAADKKKPKAPVAKAPVKPVAKPAAKAPVKPAAKSVPAKAAAKPATKVVGKAPVKPAAPVSAKGAKAVAPVAAKGAKPVKETKASHEAQKKLLDTHRKEHEQSGALDVAPRAKLQFFTLNELRELLKKRKNVKLNLWVPDEERKAREKAAAAAHSHGNRSQNIGAASIADLLGTNPFRKGTGYVDESKQIPEKFRRYYKLLEDMREALQKGLAFHSEEALKKSGKDDAGDLSGYSQHLADAGTDTADRDFALSLISNEQEALKEIASREMTGPTPEPEMAGGDNTPPVKQTQRSVPARAGWPA